MNLSKWLLKNGEFESPPPYIQILNTTIYYEVIKTFYQKNLINIDCKFFNKVQIK